MVINSAGPGCTPPIISKKRSGQYPLFTVLFAFAYFFVGQFISSLGFEVVAGLCRLCRFVNLGFAGRHRWHPR